MSRVSDTCRPEFQAVQEIATRLVAKSSVAGLAVSIRFKGQRVVDLALGHADPARTRPWDGRTLVPLTSISKTILATVVLVLVEQGNLKLDDPVRRYWPRFSSAGKDAITIRELLAHRAGIPIFEPAITLQEQLDRSPIVARIENARPLWRPGSAHGYHAVTLGFILCELLRRVGAAEVDDLVRQTICEPHKLSLHTRLEGAEATRLVTTFAPSEDRPPSNYPDQLAEYIAGFLDPTSLLSRATFGSTAMTVEDVNSGDYLRVERGQVYSDVSTLADLYALLARSSDQGGLLCSELHGEVRQPHSQGIDQVFRLETAWSLGFMLPGGPLWRDGSAGSFGHIGSSGSLVFADPHNDFAFAFATNSMKSIFTTPDPRAAALVRAAYQCIDRERPPAGSHYLLRDWKK
jgi:CubicO group peptidase (beta-lactamase class C family)